MSGKLPILCEKLEYLTTIEVFLNPFGKGLAKLLPLKFAMELLIYRLIKSTCDFCQVFLLDKRCSMQFCIVYQKISYVHFLYSFIHVFIHNSITKYY